MILLAYRHGLVASFADFVGHRSTFANGRLHVSRAKVGIESVHPEQLPFPVHRTCCADGLQACDDGQARSLAWTASIPNYINAIHGPGRRTLQGVLAGLGARGTQRKPKGFIA